MHQHSALSPLLFVIVMEALSRLPTTAGKKMFVMHRSWTD